MGRGFVVGLTIVAYAIALQAPESIFAIAIQYAFTGYAALAPLLVAALFWRGSTKWGALASTLWAAALRARRWPSFQAAVPGPHRRPPARRSLELLARTAGGTAVLGFMPVVPMVLVSAPADAGGFRAHGEACSGHDCPVLRSRLGASLFSGRLPRVTRSQS